MLWQKVNQAETVEQENRPAMAANSLICILLVLSFMQPSKSRTKVSLIFSVPIFIAMLLSTDYFIGHLMANENINRLLLFLGDIGGYYTFHAAIDVLIIAMLVKANKMSGQGISLIVLSTCFFFVNVTGFVIWVGYYNPGLYNNASIALYLIAIFILIDRRTTRDRRQGFIDKHRTFFSNGGTGDSVLHKNEETFK